MVEFDNIENIPISLLFKPDSNPFTYTELEISSRAAELDPLSPPVIKVAKDDKGFAILDGLLNWLAMKLRGMQMAYIQKFECDDADYAYMSIKLNKRKRITHRKIAMMIPIITNWWNRHNTEDKDRRRKFIADTLFDLGTPYSERNIQKLLDIIKHAPVLLDAMDNNDRVVDRFHKIAQIQAGIIPAPASPKPSDPLHTAYDDNGEVTGCEFGNSKPTGIDVEIKVKETVHHFDSSKFCRSCIVNRLTFEAVNPITPTDVGIDPDEITGEENDSPANGEPTQGETVNYSKKGGER